MPKFSLSLVLSGLFMAFILHAIYNIVDMFIPPKCNDKFCMKSYLSTRPKLQLLVGVSPKSSIHSWKEFTIVHKWKPFDYNVESISK